MPTSESDLPLPPPLTLGERGQGLWDAVTASHTLSPEQHVTLTEACRCVDRLERLDELLRGETEVWARLLHDPRTEDYVLRIDSALAEARQQQNVLKQLLTALRLPDAVSGKKPQYRGARGAYAPSAPRGVSSLDRARAAKTS